MLRQELKNEGVTGMSAPGAPEQSVDVYGVKTPPPSAPQEYVPLLMIAVPPPVPRCGTQDPCAVRTWTRSGEAQALPSYTKETGPGPSELGAGRPVEEATHETSAEVAPRASQYPPPLDQGCPKGEEAPGLPEHVEPS